MAITGEYVPGTNVWANEQVEKIEAAGDTSVVDMHGRPVVLLTMQGISGKVRKVPVMRVEYAGAHAVVASKGGAAEDPAWADNLRHHPIVELQDGPVTTEVRARELGGTEREAWWERCVEAFPPYADYATKTSRTIPVFLLEPIRR